MRLRSIQRIVAELLTLFGLSMLAPALVAWIYDEATLQVFLSMCAALLALGAALWLPVRARRDDLRLRDGFLLVAVMWGSVSLCGAVPFLFSPGLAPVDAVFESVSGLTTTGATVIDGLDDLPRSTLFYRHQLQWLGGMGIIVLAVAVLPMLGIGGMQIYRAMTPGPMKFNKLTPRIIESARALSYIYLGLTVVCALLYWLVGMTVFDAVGHAMSTLALGGFSSHDANFAYFDSAAIEGVAVIFMLLAGTNYILHFLAWRRASMQPYRENAELRAYGVAIAAMIVIVSLSLYLTGVEDIDGAARHGVFQAVSISTTAGFSTVPYQSWPLFLPVLLIMASFIGGCAGSTGGGLKVVRVLLLLKQGAREIRRLIHPDGVFSVKIGNRHMAPDVIDSVWGFFALYMSCFCLMTIMLAMAGLDPVTAFSAVAACMNNLGPGLGAVAHGYAGLGDFAKWTLCVAMLIGRLEVFTLLILLMPEFWRK